MYGRSYEEGYSRRRVRTGAKACGAAERRIQGGSRDKSSKSSLSRRGKKGGGGLLLSDGRRRRSPRVSLSLALVRSDSCRSPSFGPTVVEQGLRATKTRMLVGGPLARACIDDGDDGRRDRRRGRSCRRCRRRNGLSRLVRLHPASDRRRSGRKGSRSRQPFAMAWQALPVGDHPRPNALARRPVARRDEARRAGFNDTGAGDARDVPGVRQLRAVLSLRPAGKGCQAAAACRRVEDVSKVSVQEPTSRAAVEEPTSRAAGEGKGGGGKVTHTTRACVGPRRTRRS